MNDNRLVNDLHIYTHTGAPVDLSDPAGPLSANPDFQTDAHEYIVDNRVSTVALAANGTFDLLNCQVTTGGLGGNEMQNQNAVADANLWIPPLASTDSIPELARLSPFQRMTFSYQTVPGAQGLANLQTTFLGHYADRNGVEPFPLLQPYQYQSNKITVGSGQTEQVVINIDPAYDMLVRAFFCRCPALGLLVSISDRQDKLTNTEVFAENIAYRTFFETQNFRQPFLPWIAHKGHRYFIDLHNISGDEAVCQFSFVGQLCQYSND